MKFPNLFSEVAVGNVVLPNRVMMAAMSTGLADERGRITEDQVAYYAERANGGVGMMTVEFACVASQYGISESTQVILDNDDAIPGHRKLTHAIKSNGSVAALQLQMPGQFAYPQEDLMPVAPSEVRSRRDNSLRARMLDSSEVHELVGRFADAGRRAAEAGYDVVELHGAHGYLLHAFMSPAFNRRDDEWGGDDDRRLAFPRAVIAAVKKAIDGRPLMYRFSAEDYMRGGLGIEDMERIAPLLVEGGIDGLDVSTGSISGSLERAIDPMSLEGWRFPLSRRIKKVVDVPVAAIGSRRPVSAESALAEGDLDIVALGRPLLADPKWVAKAKSANDERIRPCTSCNWCADRVFKHLPTGCAENPRAGRELIPLLDPKVGDARQVVVVGAGPGGMAAAIQAQSVGFEVTLFEREGVLGGGLIASAAPPNKENLLWYRDYLVERLEQSKVDIRIGEAATLDAILALDPFAVIQAQGTRSVNLGIPGEDSSIVHSAYELLMGKGLPVSEWVGPAVVYGGGETGCETAELLAAHGLDVTLVSRSGEPMLARAAEPLYRKVLLNKLRANSHITIRADTSIVGVGPSGVDVESNSAPEVIPARMVIIAQGRTGAGETHVELLSRGVRSVLIGDSRKIARIGEAVHQANEAVRDLIGGIEEPEPA